MSLSTSTNMAKGQLGASVFSAMALKPHIVHVVGFSEGDHVATPEEIEESCDIARGAIQNAMFGTPNPQADPAVAARKKLLLEEARFLIGAISRIGSRRKGDPLASPDTIAEAVKIGLLDAPDLKGSGVARGRMVTDIVDGACVAIDAVTRKALSERERVRDFAPIDEDLDLVEI